MTNHKIMMQMALIGVSVLSAVCASDTGKAGELGLSREGRFFCMDGTPVFLNGVSYYGGCSITTESFLVDDLDDMISDGFNWIRVWVYWKTPGDAGRDVSVMTHDGAVNQEYMGRLKRVITECGNRGMVVDCSFTRDGNGDWVGPHNQEEHLAAVQTLTKELLPYRNVYFDLANERDVRDDRYVSLAQIGQLADAVKAIDSKRLCTASGVPGSQKELNEYKAIGKVDFITPHLCRSKECPGQTFGKVRELSEWMDNLGFRMPIHMQEPFRRGYAAYEPTVEDFYRDCSGARLAGATGWCLHNGSNPKGTKPQRSFGMSDAEGRLYKQFDAVESEVANTIDEQIGSTDLHIHRYQAEYPEQLSHQIGQKDKFMWSADRASCKAGYLSYGPYLKALPAGRHQVKWRMMIENNSGDDDVVATIDVVLDSGRKTLVSRRIKRRDFEKANQWQEFALSFTEDTSENVEFRTYWHGSSDMKLDWITLYSDN